MVLMGVGIEIPTNNKEPPGVLWWTEKCQTAVSNRRNALNQFTRNATAANYDKYIKVVKDTRDLLNREKENGFKKLCYSLNPSTPYDLICKGVKNLN